MNKSISTQPYITSDIHCNTALKRCDGMNYYLDKKKKTDVLFGNVFATNSPSSRRFPASGQVEALIVIDGM